MEEIIARRNNFIRAFHFKHSEVIRKDTGTARSHVNTGTWNVRCFKSGIVIIPRPNKRKLPGVLVRWDKIDCVEAEYDNSTDEGGWW
ncbi:hypothetical protein [Levilactobacillus fujinensis]|uniref:Uncharacterized protein n=1 Tax=Levilactobacillus fujinensis TaxID=2486024 RepID=A0ABW1TK20_9LACO|nr:hypothetical protein [Levilactobacillus fujinensis]